MDVNIDRYPIKKEIVSPGRKFIPLRDGARVKFHFQTRKVGSDQILDDSRKDGKAMELVLGKKFKLEVWELIVKAMAVNEVSKFTVNKDLLVQYPFVSKTLRDAGKQKVERRHCCGMTLQNEGIGYADLDELMANPTDLEFIIELVSVELPEDYEKEGWQMTDDEKMKSADELKQRGNAFYLDKEFKKAEMCYSKAVANIERLMLKEKPNDPEWQELADVKVPLLLNYAQCRLLEGDFYAVIEHCTEVLALQPDNVKALFRRGKAHARVWNATEAREDFRRAQELDKTLQSAVNKELKSLDREQHRRDLEDKMNLQKLF